MKMILSLLLLAGIAFGTELKVDTKASSVAFEATKMAFIGVDGNFSDFSGTISVEGNKVTAINGVIKVLSLNTDNARRDDHLLSKDFFDETKFATIVFTSTKVSGDEVVADVTIRNITKTLTFAMKVVEVTKDKVEIKLTAVVDRIPFGLDHNFMSAMINDDIDVTSTLIAH